MILMKFGVEFSIGKHTACHFRLIRKGSEIEFAIAMQFRHDPDRVEI